MYFHNTQYTTNDNSLFYSQYGSGNDPCNQSDLYNQQESIYSINQDDVIYEPEYFLNSNTLSQNINDYNLQDQQYNINEINQYQQFQLYQNHHTFELNQADNSIFDIPLQYQQTHPQEQYQQPANNQIKHEIFRENKQSTIYEKAMQSDSVFSVITNNLKLKSQECIIESSPKKESLFDSKTKNQLIDCNQFDSSDSDQLISNNQKQKRQKNQNQLKNIFNAFKGYVKQLKKCDLFDVSQYEFTNLKKQLMRYMKLHSFNHSQIKYIINHKYYKLLLLSFFENQSQTWIISSKLQDKNDVQEKIEQLTQCIKTPQHLDNFITYETNKLKK